ncbi:MAG TPA: hypothetical protein VGH86_09905 [Phenylobacterium sp.]
MTSRDVVFTFWRETWADAVRRQFMPPDRLAKALLAEERVGKLLVVDPFRSGPVQVARQVLGWPPTPFPSSPTAALFSPMRLRRGEAHGPRSLRRSYADYDRRLEAKARARGLEAPALITTNPFYAAYAPLEWTGPVTYYAWDDWSALPALERWWPDIREAYTIIRSRGHRVCAVSQTLLDKVKPRGVGMTVPNGIVPGEWQAPWQPPAWLESLPRPRILYAGAIHSRLDTERVREISRAFPEATILFVGPAVTSDVVAMLGHLPNVEVKEALPRKEIAGLIHEVEVCIMPHLRNALTKAMSPLKIYEYCAAGRPSAVTDLPPVRGIHRVVQLVPEGESFPEAVQRALDGGPMTEAERLEFLDANSWARRHDEILDLALR